jgi:hypothetical protein
MARQHLALSGTEVMLSRDTDAPGGIAGQWRWLSFALPPDLLIAALAASHGVPPPSSHISLQLANTADFISEDGIANVHLHLAAAFPFELLWTSLVTRLGLDEVDARSLDASGRPPFGSGRTFLSWLVTAALTRLTLASFLWHRETDRARLFSPFLSSILERGQGGQQHAEALRALALGTEPVSSARIRPVLRRFGGTGHLTRLPSTPEEVDQQDPLWRWQRASHRTPPELLFLHRGLSYLLQGQPRDSAFARLFWQYIRIRGLTYRYLVQEPGSAGLDWFSIHFKRISPLRKGLDRARMAAALALESRGPSLRSLEVRGSPTPSWPKVHALIQQVASAPAPQGCEPERGLVLHFAKESHHPTTHAPHADPRQLAHGCRFGSYFHSRLREAMAIEAALSQHPESLVILRGLDVCSNELSVPTWVFLPLFARLKRHSERISSHLSRWGNVPPLRFTLHAGEDFRRLIEGLRRIHEPIEFGALGVGDRLGHAVALGVDPQAWAAAMSSVWQPTEERLEDLLWELDRYRRGELPVDPSRIELVRGEVHDLAWRIYRVHASEEELLQARRLRHTPNVLSQLGFPFMQGTPPAGAGRALELLFRYLTEADVFVRGQTPIEIRADMGESRMLGEAQRFLRTLLGRLDMTVEVNPSSNVLIGDFPLEQHPIFRLQPLPGQELPLPPVSVALGDDDPITFASCLPDEFGHLFYALIRRGVSAQRVREWLERVRAHGLRARFTLPESIAGSSPSHGRGPP